MNDVIKKLEEQDLLDIDESIVDPKRMIDKIRRAFVLRNLLPVHQKLTSLINKDLENEEVLRDKDGNPVLNKYGKVITNYNEKERAHQISVLCKFAESVGSLGSEEKQAAGITKIYQKNTLVIQNPLIQQIVQAHCKELAPKLYKEIEEKKEK
jgi:hypothetical protein